MDISDILAEVDNDAVPQSTRDLQELTRAWVTERSAPEILPWPSVLIDRVLERIKRQVRTPVFLGDLFQWLITFCQDRISRGRNWQS